MPRVWQAGGCVAFRTHPPHHHSSLQASGRAVDQSASDCQRGAWGAPPVSAYNYGRGGVMNGAGAVRVQLAALTDARICPMRASLAAAALSPASADKRMFVGGRTRCCSRRDGMWTHDPLTLPRMVTQSSVAVAICLLPRGDLPCCGVSARELSLFTANHSPPPAPTAARDAVVCAASHCSCPPSCVAFSALDRRHRAVGARSALLRRFVCGMRHPHRLNPSVQDLNLVTKCKWTMCCPRYELGMLSMASKTLLFMLEKFPKLSGYMYRLSLTRVTPSRTDAWP